jgi:hypothetical protein
LLQRRARILALEVEPKRLTNFSSLSALLRIIMNLGLKELTE